MTVTSVPLGTASSSPSFRMMSVLEPWVMENVIKIDDQAPDSLGALQVCEQILAGRHGGRRLLCGLRRALAALQCQDRQVTLHTLGEHLQLTGFALPEVLAREDTAFHKCHISQTRSMEPALNVSPRLIGYVPGNRTSPR